MGRKFLSYILGAIFALSTVSFAQIGGGGGGTALLFTANSWSQTQTFQNITINGSCTGCAGNPFDQDLNTTDSPTFNVLTLQSLNGVDSNDFAISATGGGALNLLTTGGGPINLHSDSDSVTIAPGDDFSWEFDSGGNFSGPGMSVQADGTVYVNTVLKVPLVTWDSGDLTLSTTTSGKGKFSFVDGAEFDNVLKATGIGIGAVTPVADELNLPNSGYIRWPAHGTNGLGANIYGDDASFLVSQGDGASIFGPYLALDNNAGFGKAILAGHVDGGGETFLILQPNFPDAPTNALARLETAAGLTVANTGYQGGDIFITTGAGGNTTPGLGAGARGGDITFTLGAGGTGDTPGAQGIFTVDASASTFTGTVTGTRFIGPPQVPVTAIGSLPTCNGGSEGSMRGVNDALLPAALAVVAAGGAVHVPVYCDGTNWRVM